MTVIAVLQAPGSNSAANKTLLQTMGKPLLWHQIERLKRCQNIDTLVVTTSVNTEGNAIAQLCDYSQIACQRGSSYDVLDRFYDCVLHKLQRADLSQDDHIIVRIAANCPLIDPEIVDSVIDCKIEGDFDYCSNTIRPTFPHGLDVEVFTFAALQQSWQEATEAADREQVTRFIVRHADRFRLGNYYANQDYSNFHWSLENEHDYVLIDKIYQHLYQPASLFNSEDVFQLLKKHPELVKRKQHSRPPSSAW